MHWLQSLDTSLFYFINHALSNPLFDWLMPLLSGGNGVMHIFVPLAVLGALAAVFFGNTRARLCALMIVLAVGLGDPLIVNTIKHLIARPRPCIALADAIVRVGRTDSGSMPSAHAANWFAAAMVIYLFNRRNQVLTFSVLFMAMAVSFSRVYNGVHYPSDVLAGAILGAGYAAALVVVLQIVWGFAGKRWFPAWYERLPILLDPVPKNAPVRPADTEWLRLGYLLIFISLIGRWIYLASGVIELSQDEAYQWVWSKHLALSYYSKPPGIAFIQFAGTSLFGDNVFGVQFFSPLFAAVLSVIVFRLFAREVNARAAFWLLLAVTATPLLGIGSILMTIDPPLVLCWTWAMLAGWRAVQPEGKTRNWLVTGLAMGLAFLCKYSALYEIVCFGIFFALYAPARGHLRKPGPWLALLVFLVCTLPVLIWNSQHHWITVTHVAGNAGFDSHWHPTLRYFIDFVGSELALLNPVFLIAAIWAAIAGWDSRDEGKPLWLYFFCMSVPVLLGHLLWSFHSRIQPNWIAPAVVPLFCLMVIYWDGRWPDCGRLPKAALATGLLIGIFAVAVMYQTDLVKRLSGQLLPGEKDPSRRLRAWKQTAAVAEDAREKLAANGTPAFIICDHYGLTGLLSFYLPDAKAALKSEPLVYSMDSTAPANQFYFWPEYDYRAARQGQDAIFVSQVDPYPLEKGWVSRWLAGEPPEYRNVPPPESIPPEIAAEFDSVTDLGEQEIKVGDRVFHRIHLWACYDLK